MSRQQIYKEMEKALGSVPIMFQSLPDPSLELEWRLFLKVQVEPGPIPNKYRELLGLGLSAATKCSYCSFFHTEMARLNGATKEEIQDAVHYAKSSAGWSTYLHGMQVDLGQFKSDVRKACDFLRAQQK